MGSIIIGIKRFFQNKNTVTILGILASVAIIYFAYNYRIKKSTEPVNVPYAIKEIGPRTQITEEMISTKKIPGGIVTKNVLTNTSQIVGKYVLNTAVIPENGLFYESMIADWEELPVSQFAKINDGETIYALRVNLQSTSGNSIFPGNYIDIYYKTYKNGKVWVGKFIESIRVLDVVDENDNSVFETTGSPLTPAKLFFNLNDEKYTLLRKWEYFTGEAELFPVQRNAAYSEKASPMTITGHEFQEFVESKAIEDAVINGGKRK